METSLCVPLRNPRRPLRLDPRLAKSSFVSILTLTALLIHQHSAVDFDRFAHQKTSGVRRQKADHFGNFVRLANAAQRNHATVRFHHLGSRELFVVTGVNHARRRSEEHTSELQSLAYLVCRLLLEKKKTKTADNTTSHTRYVTAIRVTD